MAGLVLAVLAVAPGARAGMVVGDIQVVYFAPNSFDYRGSFDGGLVGTPIGATLDAPAFVIENTSGADITNVVLTIGPGGVSVSDSFVVGTIAPGSYVVVVPGLSNDGAAHPANGFFAHTGTALDTSDSGPNGDNVQFALTGLQGAVSAGTGIFTPAATQGASNDKTVNDLNFLGFDDGPCSNCFGPKVVATISLASVPEPATWLSLGIGATFILGSARRAARRGARA